MNNKDNQKNDAQFLNLVQQDIQKQNTFERLLHINCFSPDKNLARQAAHLLEILYSCEINCTEIDDRVLFAHHARGCTIIAAKICEDVVIFQNVTIGSNLKYNKQLQQWENVGNPIIAKKVIIADGAKILGPITIGENSFVAAGAIITKNIPANSIAYGVNKYKPKDPIYDLVFHKDMISSDDIIDANQMLINAFHKTNQS